MAFTYDPATPRGQVRNLIGDDQAASDASRVLLQDEDIDGLLSIYGNAVLLAAAAALTKIAITQALLLKKMSNMDWQADGAALARVLLDEAKRMREEYHSGSIVGDEANFEVIEMVLNGWSYDQALANAALRQSG